MLKDSLAHANVSDFSQFLPFDFVIMPPPGGYTIFLLIIGPAAVGGGIEGE